MSFKIRHCRMDDGEEVPLLIDETGLPHLLANAHVLTKARDTGKTPATQEQRLRGIARGLNFFQESGIDLTARCASGDFLGLEEAVRLADACRRRQQGAGVINGMTAGHYWDCCIDYVDWHAEAIIGRAHGETKRMLVAQRESFSKRCKGIRPNSTSGPIYQDRVGLEPEVRQLLLRVVEPGSPLNPFRKKLQLRNYVLVLFGMELGYRSGEMLSFRTKDYDSRASPASILVIDRPPDEEDRRRQKPRVKTLGRLLQPPEFVLQPLDKYLKERRDFALFPKARKHSYMFVETTGAPLTLRGLRSIFERLGAWIDDLKGLNAHKLRHTAADLDTEQAALEKWDASTWARHMEYKFGWARGSDQPSEYSKGETARQVNARSLKRQKADLQGG